MPGKGFSIVADKEGVWFSAVLVAFGSTSSLSFIASVEVQRDAKEKLRKGEETKQETERHTQVTEPTSRPRPTQNTVEAAKATQEHKPTGTKKRNNHTRHKPENARPP
jgi:hypothetical protein